MTRAGKSLTLCDDDAAQSEILRLVVIASCGCFILSGSHFSGVGLGIVLSVIFFKRRPWPVAFGAGGGLGMAYANCQHDFMHPNFFHGQIKVAEKKEQTQ